MIPINLKEKYGDQFRIGLDESACSESGGKSDPWNYCIPCKNGAINPYSGELLAFHCTAPIIRNKFAREHPEVETRNWSDNGEAIFLFRPGQFDLIAKYARPRRKRKLSASHREKLGDSGRGYRFEAKFHGSNAEDSGQISTISENPSQSIGMQEIGIIEAENPFLELGQ